MPPIRQISYINKLSWVGAVSASLLSMSGRLTALDLEGQWSAVLAKLNRYEMGGSFIFHLSRLLSLIYHIFPFYLWSLWKIESPWKQLLYNSGADPGFMERGFGTVGFNILFGNGVTLNPGLGGMRYVASAINLSWTDSIKPSLLFSNFGCCISKGPSSGLFI